MNGWLHCARYGRVVIHRKLSQFALDVIELGVRVAVDEVEENGFTALHESAVA